MSISGPIHPDGCMHGVIVGCQRDDGRWLLIRRSDSVHRAPGKVCFPGGIIEIGETQQQAAGREMREELGVDVRAVRQVWQYAFEDQPLMLWGWQGQLQSYDLQVDAAEVAEVLWLTEQEAAAHPDGVAQTKHFLQALGASRRDKTS